MFGKNKRKSIGNQQSTISKFFKATSQENKQSKKIPVISILDDNLEKEPKEEKSQQKKHYTSSKHLENAFQKLQKYDINSNATFERKQKNDLNQMPVIDVDAIEVSSVNKFGREEKAFTNIQNKPSYTPLEKQVIDIKKKYEDAILFVECGYKYRFFGEDAEVASKELNIFSHMDHNFMTASIPVHRLQVHMERLIWKGYKVGVVEQTETAALKAVGSNKNAPFTRKLTQLYTMATYTNSKDTDGQYIVAISCQKSLSHDISLDIVAVNPTTGKIIYEVLHDKHVDLLSNVETIFHHLNPIEIIIQKNFDFDASVEKFILQYKKRNLLVRIERLNKLKHFEQIDKYEELKDVLQKNVESLNLMYTYLCEYQLQSLLLAKDNYEKFLSFKNSMKLNHSVLSNLELFLNKTNKTTKGSLFRVLDHTVTPFGKRMLRAWLQQPLTDINLINTRLDAVSDLIENKDLPCLQNVIKTLKMLPDVEKNLVSIQQIKCSPDGFIKTLKCLETIKTSFISNQYEVHQHCNSKIVCCMFETIPRTLDSKLFSFLEELNESEGKAPNKCNLFKHIEKYPTLKALHDNITEIEELLEHHRTNVICRKLKNKHIQYKTISGLEYLIEVKNKDCNNVPTDWIKINSTKQFTRFRPSFVEENFKILCQHRESLIIESNKVWKEFLMNFTLIIPNIRRVVNDIATLDCLLSLAKVSKQNGYTLPIFTDNEFIIEIKDGRHPVIEALLEGDEQFVPNDISLRNENKVMLISGPNMGGKSSYIKQIAVITIMAHLGCFVPASFCKLSIIDGIYVRMGASDCLEKGKSTFMVELEEASYIMKNATQRSLVILDELGRGTSTHDGTSIAYATLKYFIETVRSFTLFVTHYPLLSEFEDIYPNNVKNYNMSFIDTGGEFDANEERDIIFLYKLIHGAAAKSYGLNVAKLAKINSEILQQALLKSQELYQSSALLQRKLSTLRDIFQQANDERLRSLLSITHK